MLHLRPISSLQMLITASLMILAAGHLGQLAAETGLVARYVDGLEPRRDPVVLERIDPTVAFDWGSSGPAGLTDRFSIHWTGRLIAPVTGPLTVTLTSDDGVRLWLDGQLRIDKWQAQSTRSWSTTLQVTAGDALPLDLEYFENGGSARIALQWSYAGQEVETIPSAALVPDPNASSYGSGTGLLAAYYDNRDLWGTPTLTRTDPNIDFRWGRDAPDPALPADGFSAQWLGMVEPRFTGAYEFIGRNDDGMRVWVDGRLIIDRWRDQGARDTVSSPIQLEQGKRYALRVDYYENKGGATAQLRWRGPDEPDRPIPQSQLHPPEALMVQIPTSSLINPAQIEGSRLPGQTVAVSADGSDLSVVELGDMNWFVEVPLSATAPRVMAISTDTGTPHTGDLAWAVTPMDGGHHVIPVDSAMRFDLDAGTTLLIAQDSGIDDEVPADPGGPTAYTFAKPGVFQVSALSGDGTSLRSVTIDVISVDYFNGMAAEVGYERQLLIPVHPEVLQGEGVYFGAGDPLRLSVRQLGYDETFDKVDVRIRPERLTTRDQILLARAGGPLGPICWHRPVEHFVLETEAMLHVLVFGNTGRGPTQMIMRPWRADVSFDFTMFASKSTFAGGVTEMTVNSSELDPDTGDPLFVRSIDPADGREIGTFDFFLETNGSRKYCFNLTGHQITNPRVQITGRKWFNGETCTVTVGGGRFVVEETTDERPDNLENVGTRNNPRLQQKQQDWIHHQRNHAIDEDGDMGSYRLVLLPGPCTTAVDDRVAGAPLTSQADCPAPASKAGNCGTNPFLVFQDGCGILWPPASCKDCEDECFLNPLHTGVLPGRWGLLLVSCNFSDVDLDLDMFHVFRADLDGFSGKAATDSDPAVPDTSTRDPFPDLSPCITTDDTGKKTSHGKKVQVTVFGPPGETLDLRLSPTHRRVAISKDASIDLGTTFDPTMLDALPAKLFCHEFSVKVGEDCIGRTEVYLHGLAASAAIEDTRIELHAHETWSYCKNDKVTDRKDETTWTVADSEPTTVVGVSFEEIRPINGNNATRNRMAAAADTRIPYDTQNRNNTRARWYLIGRLQPAIPAAQAQAMFGNNEEDACYPLTFRVAASDDSHLDANYRFEIPLRPGGPLHTRVELTWSDPKGTGRANEDHREGEINFRNARHYRQAGGSMFGQDMPTGTFVVWGNYHRMPLNNDGFGYKFLAIDKDGMEIACKDFCLFYPRLAENHQVHPNDPNFRNGPTGPNAITDWDNWFYYWSQNRKGQGKRRTQGKGPANGKNITGVAQWTYGWNGAAQGNGLFVGQATRDQDHADDEGNIPFGIYYRRTRTMYVLQRAVTTNGYTANEFNGGAAMPRNENLKPVAARGQATVTWTAKDEYDLVNITYAHEQTHHDCLITGGDADGDDVPDNWEGPVKMLRNADRGVLANGNAFLRNSFTSFRGSGGGDFEYFAWIGAALAPGFGGSYNWQANPAAAAVAIGQNAYKGTKPKAPNREEDWSTGGDNWDNKAPAP